MTNVQQIEMFEDLIEKVQNVANAIPPANPVPDVTSADNGKVLKATYSEGTGSYDWEDESGGVPTPTQADQGKVLRADYYDGEGSVYWSDSNLVPNASSGTNGQVLTTNGDTYGWANPSGGDLPEITSSDSGKVLTAIYDDKSGSGYVEWQSPSGRVGYVFLDKTEFTYDDKSGVYSINYGVTDKYVLSVVATENYGDGKQKVISEYSLDSHYSMLYIDSTTFSALSDYAYIALYYMV